MHCHDSVHLVLTDRWAVWISKDEHVMASHGQAILDNFDSYASTLEEKMRRLS